MSFSPNTIDTQGLAPAAFPEAGHLEGLSESVRNLGFKAVEFAEAAGSKIGAAFDTVAEFVHDKVPSPNSQAITARIAAGALALGVAGGMEATTAVAQPAKKPETPAQLVNTINYDLQEMFPANNFTFNLRQLVVGPRYLSKHGTCNPKTPYLPNAQVLQYSTKGEYAQSCTELAGKYQTIKVPSRELALPAGTKTVDFTPILEAAGTSAAESVGLVAGQFGSPQQVNISNNRAKHESEADILYQADPAAGATGQLHELKLRMVKGAERVTKLWYK